MARTKTVTSQQLRRIRERFGMNQGEFAKELAVGRTTVTQWEIGGRSISPAMAKLIGYVVEDLSERATA